MLAEKIPQEQERVKQFRKDFGNVKVGEVTVDMVSTQLVARPPHGIPGTASETIISAQRDDSIHQLSTCHLACCSRAYRIANNADWCGDIIQL